MKIGLTPKGYRYLYEVLPESDPLRKEIRQYLGDRHEPIHIDGELDALKARLRPGQFLEQVLVAFFEGVISCRND